MKNSMLNIFLLAIVSTGFSAKADTIWIPIANGDITFFVPLGETSPPSTPPPPPIPPIVDANLQACINDWKLQHGWFDDSEVTHLNCVARGVQDLTGINALINLEELYLGNNNISNVGPILDLYNLTTLHLASFQRTNNIYNAEVLRLSQMNGLKHVTLNITNFEPLLYEASGFSSGFNGIATNVSGDFINGSYLEFIIEAPNTMGCNFRFAVDTRWPSVFFNPTGACESGR